MVQPVLSVIVPCYNSADYLQRCVDPVLAYGDQVELLLVDDGSTDQTPQLADQLAASHDFIHVIHQPNGGHGQAINSGLAQATGYYFKVFDSDDWLDQAKLKEVLTFLQQTITADQPIDMLICNFIFDRVGSHHKRVMNYPRLPVRQTFGWDQVHFPFGKYLLMHSVIYRTSLLKDEARLQLPAHTFYVDNIYVFEPLIYVKKMYYLDIDLYHYFLGREDQSVNDAVMITRADQQLRVNRIMLNFYVQHQDINRNLQSYLRKYLQIITTITSVLLIKQNTPESLAAKKQLWQEIKNDDRHLYHQLRRNSFGIAVNLPGRLGRKMTVATYNIAEKLYGFS